MIGLIWRGMRFARGRAVALAAGMLAAAVAFSLLSTSVEVNAARINDVVGANWRGAYDLLVLPPDSVQTGAGKHLVQVNYLSTAYSGITTTQYQQIAKLRGVGVAAPLAIIGYLLETARIPITLSPAAAGTSGARVLTVTSRYTADQGLSKFPAYDEGYVYITPDSVNFNTPMPAAGAQEIGPLEQLPGGKNVLICPGKVFNAGSTQASPFQRVSGLLNGWCYSRSSDASQAVGPVRGFVAWSFPVLMAAIDPQAENELTGLGRTVTSGQYLSENAGPTPTAGLTAVPMLASTASFDGDVDQVTVSTLPAAAVGVARSGSQDQIAHALGADSGTPVMRTTITGQQAWQQLLGQLSVPVTDGAHGAAAQNTFQYWTVGPVTYRRGPGREPVAKPESNPVSVWTAAIPGNGLTYLPAPQAAADTGFRTLTEHLQFPGQGRLASGQSFPPVTHVVGEFDPGRLAGFSGRGAGSPLASYRAPLLTGADAASRAALGNQPLYPDGNLAGYAQHAPLLYTTLAGGEALEQPAAQSSGDSTQVKAPIGSIRVRVTGLHGTIPQQLATIATVGQQIVQTTGLQVIMTAGASPHAVVVGLPAGKFGRPGLNVSEDWTEIGAALVVLRQASPLTVALFVLILVVCGLFLAGAALAGVRGRRTEIGALRALGWDRRRVFTLVLGEVVTLGVVSGMVGAALSAALITGLGLHVQLWRSLLVLPVAVVLAAWSGLAPAWQATRIKPTEALLAAARAPHRGGRRIRSVTGLAVTGLTRVPGRCVLAGTGLAAGVAGLTVLLAANASFSTAIGYSKLAGLVGSSTRGTDLAIALLTITLSAASIADVTYLNLRERAGEMAALAASGWSRVHLGQLLATEASLTATAGSLAGAAAGLLVAKTAFGLTHAAVLVAVAAGAGGIAIALAATIAVLIFTSGRPLAAVLATDE